MQMVAHNLDSQFASRQLNMTTAEKQKSSERLSSGYRINRSADDTAGLQISEKMRSQIRGLNQASRNIRDGISLCQVAEGALNESHAILQRMRELSVQAANDTNAVGDRTAIQEEIDVLIEEIDRIAYQTEYNSEIYPLCGTGTESDPSAVSFPIWEKSHTYTFQSDLTYDGTQYKAGDSVTITGMTSNNGEIIFDGGAMYFYPTSVQCVVKKDTPLFSVRMPDLKCDEEGHIYFMSKIDAEKWYYMYDKNSGTPDPICKVKESECAAQVKHGYSYFTISGNPGGGGTGSAQELWIQTGANTNQGMFLSLVDATAKGVGIADPAIDVTSYDDASTSISRLEYAMRVDDNTAENTQHAESRIRDADMAEEMVKYSKHSILEQAGISMLAHANQSTQGVLSLLQ